MTRLRAWWRRLRRRPIVTSETSIVTSETSIVTSEVCRQCMERLTTDDAWETHEHYPPSEADIAMGGGTYGVALWCGEHRPRRAHRADPASLAR